MGRVGGAMSPLVEIQLNSTATNLWSTLLSVAAGAAIAQVTGWLKARADRSARARSAAEGVRRECDVNVGTLAMWLQHFDKESLLGESQLLSGSLAPLQFASIQAACLSSAFSNIRGDLSHDAQLVLADIQAAEAARSAREATKSAASLTAPYIVRSQSKLLRDRGEALISSMHSLSATALIACPPHPATTLGVMVQRFASRLRPRRRRRPPNTPPA